MLRAFTAFQVCICLLANASQPISLIERKLIGAWSWRYVEGVGRMFFAADHTVKVGFPPDDKDGSKISDDEFEIVQAGTWRLAGDVLITEIDNKPLRDIIQRLAPSEVPPFKKERKRQRILSIDEKKVVFDHGMSLERVHR
jgi:hypothetical protein